MIATLNDTTASAIDKKMTEMRKDFGATMLGRVLTLIIVATSEDINAPLEAAVRASHEHPSRVIVVNADADASSGLDAELRVGRDAGAGEIVILRARGRTMSSLDTLITPLLLPDAPIVTWWTDEAPPSPVDDVLGSISQRRITDEASSSDPLASLTRLHRGYTSGDSDLSWARLTRWRGLAATAYETRPMSLPHSVTVSGAPDDLSVRLLAAWLGLELGIEPTIDKIEGTHAGPQSLRFEREDGTVALYRGEAGSIRMSLPGDQEDQTVPVPERSLYELLAEELRRLKPDEVYGEVLAHAFSKVGHAAGHRPAVKTVNSKARPEGDRHATALAGPGAGHWIPSESRHTERTTHARGDRQSPGSARLTLRGLR